ncbi:MAG: histidine phosphatase family protein [Actinobacteria bacterium]|nr:histidine phosphatase family protein [Actinomycetota bacterium]
MAETTILLVRHGETDWNAERRVQGHTDRSLNEVGLEQIRALAQELADEPLDAIYASDLARAHETARAIADPRGLPIETLPELRERDFGTWEGLTDAEVFERYPEAHTGSWGDAETREELAERVVSTLLQIAGAHPGGRVLVVTHGGPLRAMLAHCALDGAGPIANCHVLRLAFRDGEFSALH